MKVAKLAAEMYNNYLILDRFVSYDTEQLLAVLNFIHEIDCFFRTTHNEMMAASLTGFEGYIKTTLRAREVPV